MANPEFYPRQYTAILFAVNRAITFIEQGYCEEAKTLLELTLSAAEEAYAQFSEKTESNT